MNRQLQRDLGSDETLPRRSDARRVLEDHTVYDTAPYNSSSSGGVRNFLEGWVGGARLHNRVHVWVGGDMQLSSSPNDPAFFLHHANVDRIWAAWQERHTTARYLPDMTAPPSLQFHRIDDALYSVFEERITPRQMIDYRRSYEYDSLADLIGS